MKRPSGPIGVFALALGVGLTAGVGIAGLILHYIVLVSLVTALIVPMAFLFAVLWGRVGIGRFTNATTPVLAVAISSRSSLASLPLMVERSRDALGVPERVANVVLPLAVAVFRMTSPVANLGVVFFCAAVFGVDLTPDKILLRQREGDKDLVKILDFGLAQVRTEAMLPSQWDASRSQAR